MNSTGRVFLLSLALLIGFFSYCVYKNFEENQAYIKAGFHYAPSIQGGWVK